MDVKEHTQCRVRSTASTAFKHVLLQAEEDPRYPWLLHEDPNDNWRYGKRRSKRSRISMPAADARNEYYRQQTERDLLKAEKEKKKKAEREEAVFQATKWREEWDCL